jgi:hypothetical protein
MGLLRSLDEHTEADLLGELAKRKRLREEGKCDYCERSYKTSPCKFPGRHQPSPRAQKVMRVFK